MLRATFLAPPLAEGLFVSTMSNGPGLESSIGGYWSNKAYNVAWEEEPTAAVHTIRSILEAHNFNNTTPDRPSAILHAWIRLALAHALFRVDQKAEAISVGPAAVGGALHSVSHWACSYSQRFPVSSFAPRKCFRCTTGALGREGGRRTRKASASARRIRFPIRQV